VNGAYPMTALGAPLPAAQHPLAASVITLSRGLAACAQRLRDAGLALDAWFAARAKANADSTALQGMSDRELADIGIHPAHVGVQVEAWRRDWTV